MMTKITNVLSGTKANDLKFPFIDAVEEIRQQHFAPLISKPAKIRFLCCYSPKILLIIVEGYNGSTCK